MASRPFSTYVEDRLKIAVDLHKCIGKGRVCRCEGIKKTIRSARDALKHARAVVNSRNKKFVDGALYANWFGETSSVVS